MCQSVRQKIKESSDLTFIDFFKEFPSVKVVSKKSKSQSKREILNPVRCNTEISLTNEEMPTIGEYQSIPSED